MLPPDPRQPTFLPQLLVNALNGDAAQPLLYLADGGMLTLGQVRDNTSRYVQAFTALGIKPGDRLAMLSANRPEVLHLTHACQISRVITVPLHPMGSLADHLHVLQDSEVNVLAFDAGRYGAVAGEIAKGAPGVRLLALGESELARDLTVLASRMIPEALTAPLVEPEDILRLSYSGGTTGKPKSIPSVQRTMIAATAIMLSDWEWPSKPKFLSCAPLSHAGGAMILPCMLKGGSMVVLPGFDALGAMQAIQDHQINCTMMVPTMIYAILDHPRFDEFDLSSLETVFYGASAISPPRLKEAIERIGPVFFQFYGQAEAPMTLAVLKKGEHDPNDLRRLASCGRPVPWMTVELLDGENRPVAEGEPGEICVRGPLVMSGYRNNPELNAEVFAGGWLHTGDVAVRDPGGFLRIVDRKKDMIVSGGFNIYPRELEDALATHPAVAEVAVIGVPDARWGEAVKAIVVLRPGAEATAAELIALAASKKGAYQAPKTIDFIDAIPLTPVGKPDKKALRARYTEVTPA